MKVYTASMLAHYMYDISVFVSYVICDVMLNVGAQPPITMKVYAASMLAHYMYDISVFVSYVICDVMLNVGAHCQTPFQAGPNNICH